MDRVFIVAALVVFDVHRGAGGGGYAFQEGDHMGGYPVVVAGKGIEVESVGTDDHQRGERGLAEREDIVFVLEEDDAFGGHLPGEVGMVGVMNAIRTIAAKGNRAFIIKEPQFHLCAEERGQGGVDLCFGEQAGIYRFQYVVLQDVRAVEVYAGFDGCGSGGNRSGKGLMPFEDVIECATISYYMSLEMPFFAENAVEECGAGAAGFAVYVVVGAHYGFHARVHQLFKCVEVGLAEVFLVYDGIEGVTVRFGAAVNGKVFGAGGGFEVMGVVTLDAMDERGAHGSRQVGVLAIGLLATAP